MTAVDSPSPDCVVRQLSLRNFRSYQDFALDLSNVGQVVIFGSNGSGKTSVLEAISLLVSGRGLRQSDFQKIFRRGADARTGWRVDATLLTRELEVQIQSGGSSDGEQDRRSLTVEGKRKSFPSLQSLLQVLWLVPTMDQVLVVNPSQRRTFIDHIITHFVPSHKTSCRKYEAFQQQRLKLLSEPASASHWITAIEKSMAELGVAIATTRVEWLTYLRNELKTPVPGFPPFDFHLLGDLEEAIATGTKALALEDRFARQLLDNRAIDSSQGRNNSGPTRTDFKFFIRNQPLNQCSTGEQKVLLLSFILNIARLLKKHYNRAPIILLDEVANNLDAEWRTVLYREITASQSQIWLTGTDEEVFRPLRKTAIFLQAVKQNNKSSLISKF